MSCTRTHSPEALEAIIEQSGAAQLADGFDARGWLSDPRNVALYSGGNIGLFEHRDGGTCSVHWLFVDRGRQALCTASEMLHEIFGRYDKRAVHGEIPVFCRASRMFTRILGCKSLGLIETPRGEVELFFLARADMQRRT